MLPGLSCTKKSGGVKETKKNMECSELRAMESVRTIFNTRPVPVPRITQLVLGYGECSVRSVVSQGMRRTIATPEQQRAPIAKGPTEPQQHQSATAGPRQPAVQSTNKATRQ